MCFLRLVPLLASALMLAAHTVPGRTQRQTQSSPSPTVQTSPPAAAPAPNLAGLAHIALRVRDLDASVAFYENLGFVRAFALSRDGKVYEAFIKINDRQFIELYPATPEHPQVGFLHVCFEGNDLYALHNFYIAQGLLPTVVKTAGAGNLLFTMPGPATPTGPQNMEYTQYMPGSMHSKDFGQHLGADRIATAMVAVTLATDSPAEARAFYLGKAGFAAAADAAVTLPGAPAESLEIVPMQSLGFRSRITLKVDNLSHARSMLKQRAIPFVKSARSLVVTDPDGNATLLEAGK